MNPIEVECIYCGRGDGIPCASRTRPGVDISFFHVQRRLLWLLRQEDRHAQLLGRDEDGYGEEQNRLREKLHAMKVREVQAAESLGKMSHMSACQNENDMLTPFDIKRGKCICGEAERRERLGVAAPQTLERSLVDEIQSTRDGRAALRFASENCDLRELLDIAHRIISEGQNASLTDIQAFAKGYTMMKEK